MQGAAVAIWLVFTLLLHVTSRRTQPAINRNYARIFSLSVEFPEGGQTIRVLCYQYLTYLLTYICYLY